MSLHEAMEEIEQMDIHTDRQIQAVQMIRGFFDDHVGVDIG